MSNLRDPFAEGTNIPAPKPPPRSARRGLADRLGRLAPPLLAANAALLGLAALAALALVVSSWLGGPGPADDPAADPRFVAVGRAYRGELAGVYARAWRDGATLLDAGQPPDAALDAVAKAWDSGRVTLFEKALTPELAAIVPEGADSKDITPAARRRLAAAWRGLAAGLGGGR